MKDEICSENRVGMLKQLKESVEVLERQFEKRINYRFDKAEIVECSLRLKDLGLFLNL